MWRVHRGSADRAWTGRRQRELDWLSVLGLVIVLLRLPLGLIESTFVALQNIHVLRTWDILGQILSVCAALALFSANVSRELFLLGTGLIAECGVLGAGLYLVLKLRPGLLAHASEVRFACKPGDVQSQLRLH